MSSGLHVLPNINKGHHLTSIALRYICLHSKILENSKRLCKSLLITRFITWQGSLEVNPSVLIGSFLVGILP